MRKAHPATACNARHQHPEEAAPSAAYRKLRHIHCIPAPSGNMLVSWGTCLQKSILQEPASLCGWSRSMFLPASFCLEVLQTRRKYECKCYFSSTKDRVEVLKHARIITRVLTPSSLEKLKDPQYTVPSVASGFAHLPKSI